MAEQNGKYYDIWTSHESLRGDYPDAPEDVDIVVFQRDGKLFEVNDGHCSCYGLENWSPEETKPRGASYEG